MTYRQYCDHNRTPKIHSVSSDPPINLSTVTTELVTCHPFIDQTASKIIWKVTSQPMMSGATIIDLKLHAALSLYTAFLFTS